LFGHFQPKQVETKFGNVVVHVDDKQECIFLQRHHADASRQGAYTLPHLINHRANMVALSQLVSCLKIVHLMYKYTRHFYVNSVS
jgi:hypothetical protein